jgi:hypothetical protein
METEQYRQLTLTICAAAVIILLPVSVLPVKATYRKEPQKFEKLLKLRINIDDYDTLSLTQYVHDHEHTNIHL